MSVYPTIPDNYRIEIELRDPPPRRVRCKRSIIVGRIATLNAIVAVYCLFHWVGAEATLVSYALYAMIFVVHLELLWRSNFTLLRDGVAVVGVVSRRQAIEGSSKYRIVYHYRRRDGKRGQNEVTVYRQRYEHYVEGTPLTILRHPTDYYDSKPYFLISGVEIEGAPCRNAIGGVDPETVAEFR